MKPNLIKEKSFHFAVAVVNLSKTIQSRDREFVLSKQFLRSGTSIGACVREGINAESKLDFIHKLGIAQKECDETLYWIDLMCATTYITQSENNIIKNKAEELMRIIRSIILSSKKNLDSSHS
ncbi:MAG TPA: four helix bundle protein [Bacteroidales bacterium]|nr:four helix bundle protein [Bacteroidales bacterium]